MKYTAPRGTRDIKEAEARTFAALERKSREVFARYGYEEIRTPVFETAELFNRAVGETTDIVEKEMYVFEDRGGRKLALRPEGTAGVVRAYLEHSWDKTGGGLKKLFYMGPMFRAERPQAGRYREFWQIGAEYFGNPSPAADAEVLMLVRDILEACGVRETKFLLNSIGCPDCRPIYRKALVGYLSEHHKHLCEDCRRRMDKNPLRALDCKVDGPRLEKAPVMGDSLCEKCRAHEEELLSLLASVNFQYEKAPRLVRGLDYYTRTVFEVTSTALGAQDALLAGGRYDSLVKTLGGPDMPAIGFALGLDRLVQTLGSDFNYENNSRVPGAGANSPSAKRIFVALAGTGTGPTGFKLLQDLRKAGHVAEIGAADKSLKSQLRQADGWGATHVVIVGEAELARGQVLLKDLSAHTQQEIPLTDPVLHI